MTTGLKTTRCELTRSGCEKFAKKLRFLLFDDILPSRWWLPDQNKTHVTILPHLLQPGHLYPAKDGGFGGTPTAMAAFGGPTKPPGARGGLAQFGLHQHFNEVSCQDTLSVLIHHQTSNGHFIFTSFTEFGWCQVSLFHLLWHPCLCQPQSF